MINENDLQQLNNLNEQNYKVQDFMKYHNRLLNNLSNFRNNVLLDIHIHEFLFIFNEYWEQQNIYWPNILNQKI